MDYPKLRNINIFPVKISGKNLLCLQDPQNISEKALFLPPSLYFIVSLFDGQHSILDIQAEYMRKSGEFLFTEKIQEIIGQLEENLYLEGDRFHQAWSEKEESFKKAQIREAAFAGKSYEKDPVRLRIQLEGYFKGLDGPFCRIFRGLFGILPWYPYLELFPHQRDTGISPWRDHV